MSANPRRSDDDFARYIGPVARKLLGEPNARLSKPAELRFGRNGSKAVDIENGRWFDHEAQEGGNVLELIAHCKAASNANGAALEWMRNVGILPTARKIVAQYDYVDEHGDLLFQVVRFEPKDFRQRRPDNTAPGGWSWSVKGVRRVPYKLPEITEAIAAEHLVLIVEGEKDVDNLARWGVPATCNAGGAGKWHASLSEHFRGADVILVPDNDDSGRKHMDEVGASLEGIAAQIRILDLPGQPPKGDVSDWRAAGGTVQDLHHLLEHEARTWLPKVGAEPLRSDGSSMDEQGQAFDFSGIPMSFDEWVARNLPEPDCILGNLLTTTSRILFNAPTGLGKTNFVLAFAAHASCGLDFLHWHSHRPAKILFVDGEMSRRLLKRRALDVARRMKCNPAGLFLLSHEDIPHFQPLNTPAGAACINAVLEKIGGIDVIVFDNIMSLISGEMKDEEGWRLVQPLVSSLTKRAIGQFWVHHTGIDKSRGYGTSTKEWRMDTVMHGTEAKRADTDVSFMLEFHKAREREPETRRDFESVTIALVNDEWQGSMATEKRGTPSPLGAKFLEALRDCLDGSEATSTNEAWRAECTQRGLLDPAKPHSARTLFNKYKTELIARNLIGCAGERVRPL